MTRMLASCGAAIAAGFLTAAPYALHLIPPP
jgi:hypothetical protein